MAQVRYLASYNFQCLEVESIQQSRNINVRHVEFQLQNAANWNIDKATWQTGKIGLTFMGILLLPLKGTHQK